MNRNHRRGSFELRHRAVFDLVIGRYQSGLPVVAMQNIEIQLQQSSGFQHRAAEKHKPLAVVGVIFPRHLVQLGAIEILRLIDEVDGHIARWQPTFQQTPGHQFAIDRNFELHAGRLDFDSRLADRSICRHHDRNFVPQPPQLLRQRAANVGQSARFGEGNSFACRQQNIHSKSPNISRRNPTRIISQIIRRHSAAAAFKLSRRGQL